MQMNLFAHYQRVRHNPKSRCHEYFARTTAIARAFIADPEILIWDEAASSVDKRTKCMIQDAMAKLLAG